MTQWARANLAAAEEPGIAVYSPCAIPDPATNPALREDPTQPVPAEQRDQLPTRRVKVAGQASRQLDKSAFVYDAERDSYCALQGKNCSMRTRRARPAARASGFAGCIRPRPRRVPPARCERGACKGKHAPG